MKQYLGTKLVNMVPMTRGDYDYFRGWPLPADENEVDEGYLVEYIDGGQANTKEYAGYVSWLPKDVAERNYRPDRQEDCPQRLERQEHVGGADACPESATLLHSGTWSAGE